MDSTKSVELSGKPGTHQFWLVAICFLISGFAALLYETVWLRQFAILLGTSEQALAVVLASYMGGLAIGSLVASRMVNAIQRPLLTYGILECGIALAALFVPIGISIANSMQSAWLGGQKEPPDAGSIVHVAFCFGTAFALILLPTALMGATLPLLARHVVSRDEEVGPKIGMLYAINTGGAVVGTMVAAFVCLPTLGLGATTWVGVGANMFVFLIVLALVRYRDEVKPPIISNQALPDSAKQPDADNKSRGGKKRGRKKRDARRLPSSSDLSEIDDSRYRWILAFAAISGGVSFCYEIIFTRMLGQMLGGSVYAFATMLAGFLLGIAIGGAIASRLTTNRRVSATWFVYAQAAAAICTLVTYHVINQMVVWPWESWSASRTTVQVVASIVALLPTSTCIGATFPLAIRVYARDEREAASGSARVYFWNVLGGIFGAIATGMFILPLLQYHGATALAILLNILIAVGVLVVLRVRMAHLVVPVIALVLLVSRFPSEPENVLRVAALTGELTEGTMLFKHVGKSATIAVIDDRDSIYLLSNGLPESSLLPLGVAEIHSHSAYWLSALPPLVRPHCKSMLIVGLGGGVAAELVPRSIQSIDVLELEPAVVEANRAIAGKRNHDPLSDPRTTIILNDGRNALALTDKKYDAIVSQPSHPWTAGASHLYSREFDELIRDHLNPGGIFLQWMNTEFVDIELAKSMGATLLDVFPHVRLYQPTFGVFMFVASDRPIRPEASSDDPKLYGVKAEDREFYQRLGVVTLTHLFARLCLDEKGLRQVCHGADLITDERNLLAMRAPLVMKRDFGKDVISHFDQYSPLSRGLDAAEELCPTLDLRVYLSARVNEDNQDWMRTVGLPLMKDPADRAKVEAKMNQVAGAVGDRAKQLRMLAIQHPDDSDFALQVVSDKLLGKQPDLSQQQESTIRRALSTKHQLLIDLLEKLVAGDLQSARAHDAELAQWPVDDAGYELAVRLRLPWRLEAPPGEQVVRCNEAIRIIDEAAAFANSEGLGFFRVSAAVRANRPQVALGTAGALAQMIIKSGDETDQSVRSAGIANLMRCYGILRDPRLFRSVRPERYRSVLASVEEALAEVSGLGQVPAP